MAATKAMGIGMKRLWRFGAIAPLVIMTPIWVLMLPLGFWRDGQNEWSYPIAMVAVYVGFAVYVVTLVAAFVHAKRRKDDLRATSRRRWLVGLFFLNGFLLPVFWHQMIRPLPER